MHSLDTVLEEDRGAQSYMAWRSLWSSLPERDFRLDARAHSSHFINAGTVSNTTSTLLLPVTLQWYAVICLAVIDHSNIFAVQPKSQAFSNGEPFV